jgi:hypothetical protein
MNPSAGGGGGGVISPPGQGEEIIHKDNPFPVMCGRIPVGNPVCVWSIIEISIYASTSILSYT